MRREHSYLPAAPERLQDVIRDVQLAQTGAFCAYVVDPFDIQDFCFPANSRAFIDGDLDLLADEQLALFEVFSSRPVLLDEYVYELQAIVRHFDDEIQVASNVMGTLDEADLFEGDADIEEASLEDLIGDHFNRILALALGLYHESSARLRQLVREHLIFQEPGAEETKAGKDDQVVASLIAESRETPLASEIFQALASAIKRRRDKPYFREMALRSALVDAKAIDRVISINREAERLHLAGKLGRRHVLLYLSSAHRTQIIAEMPFVKDAMPVIAGEPLGVWRTRYQVLTRMIAAGRNEDETIHNLERLREIVERNEEETAGGLVRLPLGQVIREYGDIIEQHNERLKNFGFAAQGKRLEEYGRLVQEADSRDDENDVPIRILRKVLGDPAYLQVAKSNRDLNLFFSDVKSSLRSSLLRALASMSENAPVRPFLRVNRDPVVGADQYLPTELRIRGNRYGRLAEKIGLYFRTPPRGDPRKVGLIREACEEFLRLDRSGGEICYERELVRNLLFLALPSEDGDIVSLEHGAEVYDALRRDLRRARSSSEAEAELRVVEVEIRYLMCWAARRKQDYQLGERLASEAIRAYEERPDARFFHARLLNSFSWLQSAEAGEVGPPGGDVSLETAIADAERAIELYRVDGGAGRDRVLAAVLNTLAFLFVCRLGETFDLARARRYLEELKEISDKDGWDPEHPEYLHTEAFIEYEEYKALVRRRRMGEPVEEWSLITKLRFAYSDVVVACKLDPEDRDFSRLRDKIERQKAKYDKGTWLP